MPRLTLDDAREVLRKHATEDGSKHDVVIMVLDSRILMRTYGRQVQFESSVADGLTIQSTIEEEGYQWHLESDGFRAENIDVCLHEDDSQTIQVHVEECRCFHHLNAVIRIPKDMAHEVYAPEAPVVGIIGLIQLLQDNGATDIRIGIGASPYSPPRPMAYGVIDLGLFSVGDMGSHSSLPFMMDGFGAGPGTQNLASILYNSILRSRRQTSPPRPEAEEQQ